MAAKRFNCPPRDGNPAQVLSIVHSCEDATVWLVETAGDGDPMFCVHAREAEITLSVTDAEEVGRALVIGSHMVQAMRPTSEG